jgi:hypothetical protein
MGTIQEAIEKVVQNLPRQLLSDLVVQKLDEQGVKLSAPELESLIKEILEGGERDTFFLRSERSETNRKVTLNFSAEDVAQFERKLDDFTENRLQRVLETAIEDGSRKVSETLIGNWTDESRRQRQETLDFRL